MAPGGGRVIRILCYSVSFVALAFLAAQTSFAVIDLSTLDFGNTSRGKAIAAAAFDTFAVLSLIAVLVSVVISDQAPFQRVLPLIGFLAAVTAALVTLTVLIWKKNKYDPNKVAIPNDSEFGVWALSIFTQTIFYVLALFATSSTTRERRVSFIAEKRRPPDRPRTPPSPLRVVAPPYALPETGRPIPDFDPSRKEHLTSDYDTSRDRRRPSWRESFHDAIRPRSVKHTALLTSRNSASRDSSVLSDTRSIATTAQSDPFDSWDTFNVEAPIREALSPTIPTRGRTLETIPGSRPASPAKALDGPFHDSANFSSSPASSILEQPASAVSRHDRPPTAQSTYSKRTFIPSSRPTSPSVNESHIHPLFRSDSPTPAPGTTPGTVVHASPMGGQIMPPPPTRSASRLRTESRSTSRAGSRAGSRAPSPATFTREHSFDERPSFSSIAEHRFNFPFKTETSDDTISQNTTMTSFTSSPYAGTSATMSTNSMISTPTRSRSNSPSSRSRPMTPPIPEFILSARKERLSSKSSKETLKSKKSRETVKPA